MPRYAAWASVGALLLQPAAAHELRGRGVLAAPAETTLAEGAAKAEFLSADGALKVRDNVTSGAVATGPDQMVMRLANSALQRHGEVPTLQEAIPSLLMASLAGLTTVLGAFVVFAMPGGPPPWAMAFALSLAAGVMVTVASELVWGKSRNGVLRWVIFALGMILTRLLTTLATVLERRVGADASSKGEGGKPRSMWRLSMVLFISLTLHNFPEGMAVAVTALQSSQLGLTICISIACHNIPEGITIAVTTYQATKSRSRALLMTFLSGVAEPIGAVSAVLVFRNFLTSNVVECLVAGVAGVMLYISLAELLPEAVSSGRWLWVGLGFVSGIVVIVITTLAIDKSFE
mmetsp:Transcript_126535/g.369743  ORF Transcript_126535/g.369743 Transcript_126535/m.369743 type:complete len:347 (-) Transcript_126535:109-1149(-)